MLFSELGNKEIVNLNNGERLGLISSTDLLIDEDGYIKALLVPDKRVQFNIFKEGKDMEIPWSLIKKIGNDMIIVEI